MDTLFLDVVCFYTTICLSSSFLIDFFGCIKVGFVGGLTSTIGLLITSQIIRLKISIVHTFLPYGVIFGIGQSLIMTIPFAILRILSIVNGSIYYYTNVYSIINLN